jgi:4'-phosphopantetheinyl transferase
MLIIYKLRIDGKTDSLSKYLSLVSDKKQKRLMRYRFIEDVKRSLFGELIVRWEYMNKLGIKNKHIVFETNEYGKPFVRGINNFHFNITHSGLWVMAAFSSSHIGIDIEVVKPIELDIARKFFSKEEYCDILNQSSEKRLEYFYKLWTLKESYIKAMGNGLSISLNSFTMKINNRGPYIKGANRLGFKFINGQIDTEHIYSFCYSQKEDIYQVIDASIDDIYRMLAN